ncbi:MAG: 5'-3' exonuclease H3TH domain-containing protein [Actinomycetes bacterium]
MTANGALIAVDGDNFAHRSYHALPKTMRAAGGRPANALTGVGNLLLRLWDTESPAAIVVAWDSLETPTYRHQELIGYQSGREFDEALLDQLSFLPDLVELMGFTSAKAPGYEADDFLAAAAANWDGPVLIATADRDAFQLVSERVTILQPQKGGSLVRVGPAEVRERYGVDPEQVTDFVALRGDPSDKIPGAPGIGEKTAARILNEFGTLEATLASGRFDDIADDLRLYRRIATMNPAAPIPALVAQTPDWARAADGVGALGLDGLARRLAEHARR